MTALMHENRARRPSSTEYAPYYETYVSRVPDGDVVEQLTSQIRGTLQYLRAIPEGRGGYRYAPGKWSIKEVVGHLADAERVFSYRAMRFARQDATPLAGFDENLFVANARFDARSLASLLDEFEAVRRSTVALFGSLDDEEWGRAGEANGRGVSVRALAWIAAGHELHHLEILRTRYQ